MDDLYLSLVSLHADPSVTAPGIREPASMTGLEDPAFHMMAQDMAALCPTASCANGRRCDGRELGNAHAFLDPDVVSISTRPPLHMKTRESQGKWARRILYSHVPHELIERHKAGFGIPIGDWFREPTKGLG